MTKGFFITFEGAEGTGKSTQTRLLTSYLETKGIQSILTREPGGSDGAEQIRSLVLRGDTERWDSVTEMLLMYAARRDHVQKKILPALNSGKTVICDRFADSTMAYQGYGYGKNGIEKKDLNDIYRIVLGDFKPDLTLIMDLPVEIGLARSLARDPDSNRYERMGKDFHHNLRKAFLDIAENNPDRCVVIDASKSVEDIATDIKTVVNARLLKGK